MSIKEIIDHLDELEKFDVEDPDNREALRAAIEKLRTHQDAQLNEPLTLEELRGMYGKPVWVEYKDGKDGRWGLVGIGEITFQAGEFCVIGKDGFGEGWKAYRRPPKEEHHEETP